jgi:hypothetical protein
VIARLSTYPQARPNLHSPRTGYKNVVISFKSSRTIFTKGILKGAKVFVEKIALVLRRPWYKSHQKT